MMGSRLPEPENKRLCQTCGLKSGRGHLIGSLSSDEVDAGDDA